MNANGWRERMERLCGALPEDRLHPTAIRFLQNLSRGGRCGLACSGGADSVCLALIVCGHLPKVGEELILLHFNHALRGLESDEDQRFVESLGDDLAIPVEVARWKRASGEKVSEDRARKARFAFFHEAVGRVNSRVVLLGHHADDVAENLLMRVARGSGTDGLAGMRPVHRVDAGITHVRPLLNFGKSEISDALRESGVPWREDGSNAGDCHVRNRVRHRVIPALRAAVPHDPVKGAIRTRALLEEDAKALEVWLDSIIRGPEKFELYSLADLRDKPKALIRRAIERFIRVHSLEASLGRRPVEELIDAVVSSGCCRVSAGPSDFVTCQDAVLSYERRTEPAEWSSIFAPVGASVYFPGAGRLSIERVSVNDSLRERVFGKRVDTRREAVVACDEQPPCLLLRRWEPGDRFQPLGSPGSRKLQDVFTDRRIAPPERMRVPLVCTSDGELLWVPGIPPAESFKIRSDTRFALRLTYTAP